MWPVVTSYEGAVRKEDFGRGRSCEATDAAEAADAADAAAPGGVAVVATEERTGACVIVLLLLALLRLRVWWWRSAVGLENDGRDREGRGEELGFNRNPGLLFLLFAEGLVLAGIRLFFCHPDFVSEGIG